MPLPTGNHTDWIWPFSLIPRSANAVIAPPPTQLYGNTELVPAYDVDGNPILDKDGLQVLSPKPIPNPGEWQMSTGVDGKTLGYIAFTTKNGWHFRIGDRWDNIDSYTNRFSFKIGKYNTK